MIRQIVTVFIFLFTVLTVSGQRDSVSHIKVDTLRVQTIDSKSSKNWYESPALPSITALAIALAGIAVNLIIAYSNQKMILKQTAIQNTNNTELAAKKYIADLHAANRQEWINKVRDCASELTTQCKVLNIAFQENNPQDEKMAHEKVTLYRNQLLLYLNDKIPEHKAVLRHLSALMDILDKHLFKSHHQDEPFDNAAFMKCSTDVIEMTREMLYAEWGKIQEAQKRYFEG